MTERKEPRLGNFQLEDRIPVLNVRATPDAPNDSAPTSPPKPLDDATIQALADRVLDRIAPILHDALVENIGEFLAERERRPD